MNGLNDIYSPGVLRKEEALRVIESYKSILADPIRMMTMTEPELSRKLFKIRIKAIRVQYGITKRRQLITDAANNIKSLQEEF